MKRPNGIWWCRENNNETSTFEDLLTSRSKCYFFDGCYKTCKIDGELCDGVKGSITWKERKIKIKPSQVVVAE